MATNSRLSARPRRIAVCAGFNEDPDISTWLFDKVALWCGHNLNIGSSPLTSTSAEALPCPTRPKWKVLVDGWVRGVCVSFSTKAREGGLIDRQCAALDVTAAVFSHVNGASVDYYNVYSWIVDRSTRPPNAVLGAPVILVPLIYLYSCACFVAAALDPATQRRDPTAPAGGAALQRPHGGGAEAASLWDAAAEDSDPNGDERLRRFARSFDVALGYSAGVSPASAISKSDSMDKMGTFCVDLMMVGASNCLFTLESHNKQWGKELMGKSWMSLVKGPLNVVEKRLTEVNAEFPETPLFASIILAPNQTVVCGHPDSLEKLRTLAPQQFKLLPVKEAYHTSFYQTEVQNKFISSYPKERYAFAAPLSDGCTTISSSTNTDSSQLDAASFVIRLQRDSIENKIDWPETVKAGISCNGGCDSVEIFDFGPPGIGILTHNLCGALFKKKSTFINCVTAHDPPKEPTALPISTTVTPTPKLDTSTLTLVEKKVHELWCEALPAPPSSIDEDFFEAGGDSIAALKMLTAANNLGWNLSIVELFSSRTIRSVAALVAASTSSSSVTSTKARYPPITASTKVLGKRKAPLSLSQHRLFFLDQLQPNSVQYSVFGGIHLIGPLNCSAVQKAANSIAVRHESIRTRFMTDDGSAESYQLVLPPDDPGSAIKFSEELYKGIPTAEEKAKWLSEQFRKEVNIPFDLQRGPLVRLTLFRLTEEETVLFIIAHHIITDGWSMVLFLKELSCNYNQVLAESKPNTAQMETAPLSPLPFQYADFAIWQREVLLGPSNDLKEKQMSFWKKELEGVNSVCELPLDRPRTDNRTYSAGFHIHIIPPSLFSALSSLGRTISTSTPFMTVLTVFNLLLHLHSPRWFQDQVHTTTGDMVVGIPTANRHYTGVGSLFGFFVNTLPIRTIIEESKSFKETLDYVKGKILSVQEAQDVPLDWIVDATHIETRMSMHTLVQVLFVMDDWKFLDKKNFTMEGIRDLKPLYNIPPAMSKVDLTLNAVPQPDGSLELQFEFAKDILDESTVVRLANNMDTLIRSVLSTPNKPISQLKVINDADIKRFATWNSTEKYFKTSEEATRKAVHFMFEESVSKHASFPALQLGNVTVRYDELNNRTNQLAHFLKSTHPEAVGPGKFIPIIAERSIEQFVALYGVLKAGAAYVPIDPESPPDRISAILEDISPVSFVILSHKSLRSQLPPEQPFQVISILEDGDLWKSFPTTNPPHNIETGSEEVYAIFTSGSTGKPKAAVNHHLGVANFVMWLRDEYKLTTEDRILHKTPFFFDGCALEVFASLASGSCVVIAPPGAHQDPEQLLQLVRDNRVTVLLLVPTMLREFISTVALQGGSASPRPIKSLRTIISAGESLHWELVHKVFDCLGKDITFHNHYGPSEASCCTTFLDCSESLKNHPEMETNNAVVPLGKPIPNVRVVVVDRNLQPVPVGVVGEICVGGVSVGKGYLSRPELTSSKFVSAPASDGIVYRTGDLGRLLPSGDVEFHGRVDFQVKLHGLRIELGEIEKVIHSHGMVEACTVVLREDQPGVKFLAAYLVPKDKSLASSNSSSSLISEVRNFLESKFPLYMVPSTYTVMEQLPLTSTGKLNIKSLPIPSAVEANPSTSRSPFNESTIGEEERVLLNCWKETLPSGSSALTLDTDFFQAGGDSIMALQAASKARMRGLNVTLRDFFELRTIGRIIAAKVTVNLVSSDHHLPDPKMMICLPADAIPERFLSLLKEKGIAEDQVESVFPATPNQVGILLQCFAGGDKDSQQYEERGGGLYNTQLRIDYQGDLDVGLFKRAWEAVVDDHPALRSSILFHAPTTTDCSDQNPFVQVVFKHVDLDWDQPDLTGIESASSGTPDERLIQFTAKMKVAPFDFEKPSLLRCHVVSHIGTTTLAPPFRHTFICEVHHVITDGWSTANIIHQVHETYSSMSSSSSNGSPPRQLRGRIVVHNFMKWLSVRDNKKGVQYWEKYFDGFSEPTPLPFYSLTTAISPTNIKNSEKNISIKCANESAQEDTHQSFRFEIGTTLTRKVHEFAKSHNTTVNVVLQLTWGLVLHTLAGWLHSDTSDDATFGTVLSGRPDEVDNIGEGVGLFVCTIPVRLRVQANTSTVGSLLEELHRHILLDMTEHASSVHLGEITQIVRRRHPEVQTLFETLFVFQNFPIPSFEQYSLKGLSVTGYSGSEQSHYPLVLTASLSSLSAAKCASLSPSSQHHKVEVIKLCFDYNTVIHSQGDLSRVRDCFEHLLGSVVSDPVNERKISDLDKVSPSDKQFLTEINTTNKEFPGKEKTELAVQKAVHFMFEESVLKHGSLPALKFNTKTVTYEELNNRTNQLAHFLKSTHPEAVGPGKFIPIIAERSIEQFVALYGVLKAGAAYVPIDPESPPDRISAILEDISPVSVVILSHKSLRSQLPPEQPFQVISILEDGDLWKSFPTTNPPHNIETGSEEVYAIFTSGSTGKPKAAVNHHLGVANFVMWLRDEYKLTTEDRILHKTPVFFDGCALEVFASLVSGSCVVIAPPGAHQDPEQLLQLVRDNRVTVLLLVPTMLREFISTVALAGKCRFSLRAVISAGESLHWELVHRVFDCLGKDITFHNHYGPSEASCCTTFLDCSESLKNHPEMETNNAVVPLGKPIPNVRVVIVDRNLQPVPIGVVGEICVGGVSVGKGYLSRPELTSSKFVSAPASDGIVYRTGDLGRLLPSGDVEFHGRVDFQVKLHGLRIELGEIESTILKNVSVESCAVIVREDTPGVKFLAAYLVPKDKSSLPSASTSTSRATVKAEITALLQSLLPPYMVPSTFTLLPQLPLTPTGKLDRKALPVPGAEQPSPAPSFDALLPTEELLVQCLRDALPSAFVSVLKSNSDFFSSGGTSLYVIRAAEAARKRGIKLTLRDFFEGRTIKGIAARIGNLTPMAVVDKQERPQEIPLSFAQQRLFFLDKMFPGSTQYNMCGGVELEGVLDGILLHQALRSVVLRHESLRTRFAGDITAHQIIISEEDVDSSFEMQTAVFSTNGIPKEKWLESILARESQKVYNLQTGPLLRMTFCKVDEEKCGLIVCMHHIISDGWSMGVFLKDLTEAYNNGVGRKTTASTSSAVPLIPKLAVQYVDFALWQKKFLDSDNFGKQLEYWQKDLEGVTEVAALPLDRPRTNKRNYEAGTVIYQVPIALWQELVQLGQSHRTTPFSTLLAVFQALLHRYSRMESEGDIVVGIPTANRHYPGVESMIGFFVNTLVIRVSVDNNEGFASLLDKVSRKVMASQGAQDVPFDKVVEVVGVERRLSVQPLIQVMFTMDEWNLLDKSTFSMAGVKGVREIPMTKEGLTKFDLTLSATQRESSLELNFEFARDILDTETVESMAVFMEILIRRAVSVPSDPIWKIVSLAPAEERRIEEWNSTAPVEPFKPLMTLFEEQVEKHPTGVALKMGSKTLTFHMLNCQVNQLANFLIDKYSIQPNDFIAILSDISFELFVAIYVVLKSGGAYLPIDLDSPSDRILSLLNDAKPKVILISKSSFLDLIPSSCGDEFPVISLDGTEYVHSPVTNPPCPIKTGEESIYVIPTSGSTGIPKLAVTNHLGATNYVRWFHTTDLQGTASDRCLHKTPYYFDASIGEIFSLCVSGCTVVLPERPEHIKDPEEILKLIVSEKITLVDTVPTMLNEIISLAESLHLEPDSIALRHAITGGEALHWELVRNFMKVFPRTVLDNHYGPSETSCSTTFWTTEEFDPKAPIHWPTPLGKPVPGAKVFLLDNNLHPVPFGSVGEICIGGIAVGKGYINREQLTAEKFVNVPFCAGKIYRTGDLGRILHRNGELQFVGRIDFQVKLNGLRIELGGLESTLHTHTCVKDAAVVMKTNSRNGSKYLAGYVVPSQDVLDEKGVDLEGTPAFTKVVVPGLESELLDFMATKVPQYMIPSTMTFLSSMPVSRSGKTDRKALEAMVEEEEEQEEGEQPPITENEKLVCDIWQEAFGFSGGIRTNFFHAGGNSIILTRVSKMMLSHGILITMEQFFQEPTIFGLARIADEQQQKQKNLHSHSNSNT